MKRFMLFAVGILGVVILANTSASAAPFDPLFRITEISGECMVKTPESANFAQAEEGKAYPYGTQVKTGRKSSSVIVFSEGNTARVLANATLTMTKDTRDPKLKIIKLDLGKVEIKLEEEFNKNDALNVETPTAVCAAISCSYVIEVKIDPTLADAISSLFLCKEGKIKVFGAHFEIKELKADDYCLVFGARDKSFLRIKCVKGSFDMELVGEDGTTKKTVTVKAGAVVKIWWAKSEGENKMLVSIIILNPDNASEESWQYNEELAAGQGKDEPKKDDGKKDDTKGGDEGEKKDDGKKGDDDGGGYMHMTTTNRPGFHRFSTTTTIPSPTPVGKR